MNAYEQKQEARRERLERAAQRAHARSDAAEAGARSIADRIPLGQPILVGHHSEKRARRDARRIRDGMRRAIDEYKRAQELERRAAAVGSAGISSDDPEAVRKLEAEVLALEAKRDTWKAINNAHAAYLKRPESLADAELPEHVKATIRRYVPAYSWEPHPIAPYQLTNLGANIRAKRARIATLREQSARLAEAEASGTEVREIARGAGYVVELDLAANRLRIRFPGKPSPERIRALKSNGFRWAPSEMAWQRMATNQEHGYSACLALGGRYDMDARALDWPD